jgi:hypothetical protein
MILAPFLLATFVTAQQPRPQTRQLQRAPVQRQLLKQNVTVVDIRTATPLVAKVQAAREARKSIAPPGSGRVVARALNVAQVRTTLAEAGISDVSPAGEYASFSPTRLSAGSKGHMLLQSPLWVDADQVQFDASLDENPYLALRSGPKVRLLEAGAYVLDFLVDLPDADSRQSFRCDVLKGEDVFQQIECPRDPSGPQHILVVFQQGTSSPQNPWIGICLHNKDHVSGPDWIRWYLYQVVVTKL